MSLLFPCPPNILPHNPKNYLNVPPGASSFLYMLLQHILYTFIIIYATLLSDWWHVSDSMQSVCSGYLILFILVFVILYTILKNKIFDVFEVIKMIEGYMFGYFSHGLSVRTFLDIFYIQKLIGKGNYFKSFFWLKLIIILPRVFLSVSSSFWNNCQVPNYLNIHTFYWWSKKRIIP